MTFVSTSPGYAAGVADLPSLDLSCLWVAHDDPFVAPDLRRADGLCDWCKGRAKLQTGGNRFYRGCHAHAAYALAMSRSMQ